MKSGISNLESQATETIVIDVKLEKLADDCYGSNNKAGGVRAFFNLANFTITLAMTIY